MIFPTLIAFGKRSGLDWKKLVKKALEIRSFDWRCRSGYLWVRQLDVGGCPIFFMCWIEVWGFWRSADKSVYWDAEKLGTDTKKKNPSLENYEALTHGFCEIGGIVNLFDFEKIAKKDLWIRSKGLFFNSYLFCFSSLLSPNLVNTLNL